jgi:hypothetical protein
MQHTPTIAKRSHGGRSRPTAQALILLLGACGGGSAGEDAAPDIDNGACGAQLRFTGEYVDWDHDMNSCGIDRAQFTIQGTAMQFSTPPNGRIDTCIPDQPTVLIDVAQPSAVSACNGDAVNRYMLPALAVANKAVILAGGQWRGRAFVQGREVVDPAKAHVFVHVEGTPRAVSLEAGRAHGTMRAVVSDTWAPGDTGHEVFIPDVDPAGGSAMLSVAGDAIGTGSIPLVAGKMTMVTVVAR